MTWRRSVLELTYPRAQRFGKQEEPDTRERPPRLASTLFRLLRDRHVALPDDEELLDELANVRLRETSPGVLRMDHDPDKHDDRAIAVALAAFTLVERPPSRGGYAVTVADRTIGVDFGVPEPYELIRGDGSRVVADGDDWWSRNVGPYATGGA